MCHLPQEEGKDVTWCRVAPAPAAELCSDRCLGAKQVPLHQCSSLHTTAHTEREANQMDAIYTVSPAAIYATT